MTSALELPPTEKLLVSGGDTRIQPDPVSGVSIYGCRSRPDPAILAFGSSTASTISEAGFAAADALRRACADQLRLKSAFRVYADETERLRVQLSGLAPSTGVRVVLAASGTDLHLLVAQWIKPKRTITVVPAETGSGVPAALQGRHFNTSTAYACGSCCTVGDVLHDRSLSDLVTLLPRHPDGSLRSAAALNEEYIQHVTEAVRTGGRILLVLTDVSKTNLIVPDIAILRALKRRWPDQIEVLVDACQFRLSPETITAYIREEWMVGLTGSKFIAGPAFCGCLLVPHAVSERYRKEALHSAVGLYSSAADWPSDWAASCGLPSAVNFGLLLRWEAAITEWEAFRSVPNSFVMDFLRPFAEAVRQRIETDAHMQALPVRPLSRPFGQETWDGLQTIFPFLLYHGRPLRHEETLQIYRSLLSERHIQFGQPVICGQRDGITVSALRLSVGAPMVAAAYRCGQASTLIDKALYALDQVTHCVQKTIARAP